MLGLGKVAAKEVYGALDWLGREQPFIEAVSPAFSQERRGPTFGSATAVRRAAGCYNPLYNSNNAICRRARAPTLASLQTPSVHLAHDLRHFGDMVFDYGISRAIGCRL